MLGGEWLDHQAQREGVLPNVLQQRRHPRMQRQLCHLPPRQRALQSIYSVVTSALAGEGRHEYCAPRPCLIESCLGLASPKGQYLAAFACSLSTDAPCLFWQEQHVIKLVITSQQHSQLNRFVPPRCHLITTDQRIASGCIFFRKDVGHQ